MVDETADRFKRRGAAHDVTDKGGKSLRKRKRYSGFIQLLHPWGAKPAFHGGDIGSVIYFGIWR